MIIEFTEEQKRQILAAYTEAPAGGTSAPLRVSAATTWRLPLGYAVQAADLPEPRCFTRRCRHYQGVTEVAPEGRLDGRGEEDEVHFCSAFPSGIPDRIAYGDDEHLERDVEQFGDAVYEKG